MEPLFRLALVRPPVQQDPAHPSIDLTQGTPFQKRLRSALGTDDRRHEAVAVARAFVESPDFIGDPLGHALADQCAALDEGLSLLVDVGNLRRDVVVEQVENAFGAPLADVVAQDAFEQVLTNLRDSIVAVKLLQEEHGRPVEALTDQLRDLEVVQALAGDETFPRDAAQLRRHRRRSLALPGEVALRSVLSSGALDEERRRLQTDAERERRQRVEELLGRYRDLVAAASELTRLHGDDLRATAVQEAPAAQLPERLQPAEVLKERAEFGQHLSALTLRTLEASTERDDRERAVAPPDAGLAELVTATAAVSATLLAGKPAFEPPEIADLGFRVAPRAAEQLSEATTAVLAERGVQIAERPLDRVVEQLRDEGDAVRRQLDAELGGAERTSVKRVGDVLLTISTPVVTAWSDVLLAGGVTSVLDLVVPDERVPQTRGDVAPAGVADLLVVKQQLVGYEGADVAHIENVLKGESKRREHLRRNETEQVTFTESEVTTSEERELESTTRFEMSRETSATIKEDASLKAGLTVSGKYGPVVEFSASAEGSLSRSKEESTKAASSFSQDVTERSVNKITERVLQRSSLRTTSEVTEKNEHGLDNTTGPGHVSGVYQWVNKVYQAQMFNYGLRTMFDFMVPEPAAMVIKVLQSAHASAVSVTKPTVFFLQPDQVTEANYGYWVRSYGATDVQPPPDVYTTVAHDYSAGGGDDKTDYNHSARLTVPDGYRAVHGTVGIVSNTWEAAASSDVVLGRRTQRIGGGVRLWATALDDEQGAVPFALNTWRLSDVAVAIEVKCQRTTHAMRRWAADTHAKLTNAYRARLAEYEEKIAALELQAGVVIEGRNPAANLEIIGDELKKHCVSILTDQHFDLFGAVDTGYHGLPQVDVHEAAGEGAYVRFFEQAFEWEHMTWVTYPYFWGRKQHWAERITFEDPDPMFNQFLKSGFCRVSVPARPGFEGAIDHFITFGELWNGGPLPAISSALYLPIADEIAERLDRPGEEVPQGDPWTVRIPTTLVTLRADDRLPRWEQADDGTWAEA